ncbi:riboflavin synthase [Chlamydiota bacterium]
MFTGLITDLGKVDNVKTIKNKKSIRIQHPFSDLVLGESIAVNGICLTVSSFSRTFFISDILQETYRETTLSFMKNGEILHLERALQVGDRIGGHFLTGHIDDRARITTIQKNEDIIISGKVTKEKMNFLVKKGSIGIDGVSLTIADCNNEYFTVHIVSHTARKTKFKRLKVGDVVNIEYDILLKHTASKDTISLGNNISKGFLEQHGFF